MQPADLNLTTSITGHQRFLFIRLPAGGGDMNLAGAWERLGDGMENMQYADGPPSADAFRRGRFQILSAEWGMSREQGISHPALMAADCLVRLEGEDSGPLVQYEEGLRALLDPSGGSVETLSGVQRPRSYTSHAMTQYAYTRAQQPGPGSAHPLGVVTPMNKNARWWSLDWMHRESFFLPRYDAQENMVLKGHALAADAGISCITRRLVHAPEGYGRDGAYDFVGYFEFAEADAPTFRAVMSALRDVKQNPEWAYVSEGPGVVGPKGRRTRRAVGEVESRWLAKTVRASTNSSDQGPGPDEVSRENWPIRGRNRASTTLPVNIAHGCLAQADLHRGSRDAKSAIQPEHNRCRRAATPRPGPASLRPGCSGPVVPARLRGSSPRRRCPRLFPLGQDDCKVQENPLVVSPELAEGSNHRRILPSLSFDRLRTNGQGSCATLQSSCPSGPRRERFRQPGSGCGARCVRPATPAAREWPANAGPPPRPHRCGSPANVPLRPPLSRRPWGCSPRPAPSPVPCPSASCGSPGNR